MILAASFGLIPCGATLFSWAGGKETLNPEKLWEASPPKRGGSEPGRSCRAERDNRSEAAGILFYI